MTVKQNYWNTEKLCNIIFQFNSTENMRASQRKIRANKKGE